MLMSPEQSVGQNHKGNMDYKSLENIISLNIWERWHMKTLMHINLMLYIFGATILHILVILKTYSMHNIIFTLLVHL
jgi:hypothetical protein